MSVAISQDDTLALYLAMVGGGQTGLIEVRYRARGRGMRQHWRAAHEYRALASAVRALGRKTDVYVVVAPRVRRHIPHPHPRAPLSRDLVGRRLRAGRRGTPLHAGRGLREGN